MAINFANLQFPATITIDEGSATGSITGRIFKTGVTDAAGAPAGIIAELGFGPSGSDPTISPSWTWSSAAFSVQVGNDDEFSAAISGVPVGTYAYTFRFSDDGGATWTYADLDGNGINAGLGFSAAQLGTLTVNNVNDAPTDIVLSATSINENNAANALVATLSAVDADAGDTFTFTLVAGAGDTDNAAFTITGNQLTLNSAANFEVKPSYSIRLLVTDAGGLTHEITQVITVGDVNEAPNGIAIFGASVAELAANGTVVGSLVTSDPDAGNTITYSLLDDAGGRFGISGSNMVVADRLLLDFEQNASHFVTVRATDQNGLFVDSVVSLSVTNVFNEIIAGDASNNTFVAGGGTDILDGGLGSDQLAGGDGDDYYYVDELALTDIVTETNADFVTGGNDLVTYTGASGTYVLGANIERLTLGGVAAINATGNALANIIIGNSAANSINGSSGADTMFGGNGADTYFADLTSDVITETSAVLATGGNDIVYFVGTSGTFTLSANVERLALSGTAAISGTGNALVNTIYGNAAANTINGGGGADILSGGDGTDTYFADLSTDVVVESNAVLATGGNDIVYFVGTTGTFAMSANVERLTLSGSAAVNGTGNTLANTIIGNGASNVINGMLGNDILTGGLGSDFFVFNTLPNATTNRDTITDYNVAADTIRLENTGIFTALGLATGVLNVALFKNLTTGGAVDASDRILYNDATGAVLYDIDGSGAAAAIQFATITGAPTLTNADFVVI